MTTHFEHLLIWKYCIVFGTFFNDIAIQRGDSTDPDIQKFKVPIEFAPKEKYLAMTTAKPDGKKRAIQLPRMSFEFTGMSFDETRKLARQNTVRTGADVISRSPWNLNFRLSIITKNMLDATKIVEQVLFMFQPDVTVDVKLLDGFDHIDRITTDYISVSHEDEYKGGFEQARRTVWDIDFVMKGWLYGPVTEGKQIKKVNLTFHPDVNKDAAYEQSIIIPGLTDQGLPTTDPSEAIPYQDVEENDDYAIIIEKYEMKDGPM
jgi:hypothetical protein